MNVIGPRADENVVADLPGKVRVSVGSAVVLGLLEGKLDAEPTTAYLMTFRPGKCTANCVFCPQARTSRSKAELLSRISWPVLSTENVLRAIVSTVGGGKMRRVCFQALNYPNVFQHLVALVKAIKQRVRVPVSVSCQPLDGSNLRRLARAGVDRIGIAIDAATKKLFDAVKGSAVGGPYGWEDQFRLLREAVEVLGKGRVSTHLIVGLGETEKEAVHIIQRCVDMSVLPALFAFTPVRGTALESWPQPRLESYRRIQLARYLVLGGAIRCENMRFDVDGRIVDFGVKGEALERVVATGEPFLTSGCPDCNRPFYNEKPGGSIYNYPRRLQLEEIAAIKRQLIVDKE